MVSVIIVLALLFVVGSVNAAAEGTAVTDEATIELDGQMTINDGFWICGTENAVGTNFLADWTSSDEKTPNEDEPTLLTLYAPNDAFAVGDERLNLTVETDGEEYWDDEAATATLERGQPSTEGITVKVAPRDVVSPSDDINDILEVASPRREIAAQDIVVIEIEASGVLDYLLDEDDEWDTDNGLDVILEKASSPTENTSGENTDRLSLSDGELDDAAVHISPNENQFYLVFDESELQATAAGERWTAKFEVTNETRNYPEYTRPENVSTSFDIEERSIELIGDWEEDRIKLWNTEWSWIAATTNIAPETKVHYVVEIENRLLSVGTTVSDDGSATATFDLSEFTPDDEISRIAAIERGAGVEAYSRGVIVAGPGARFVPETQTETEVTVDEDAELNVTVTNVGQAGGETPYEVRIDDEIVDEETLSLAAGESASEQYAFDTAESGDIEWTVTVEESLSGTLSVSEKNDEAPNDTGDYATNGTGESSDDAVSDENDDAQPGLGFLSVLVALAALLTIASWRR